MLRLTLEEHFKEERFRELTDKTVMGTENALMPKKNPGKEPALKTLTGNTGKSTNYKLQNTISELYNMENEWENELNE